MKVLLLNPKVASGWAPYSLPPIGLGYLKACLLKAGIEKVKIVDMSGLDAKVAKWIIQEEMPNVVGLSMFTEARHNVLEVAEIAKAINSNIKVILGSVHATMMYKQVLEHYPFVDIICRGESEETMVDLLQNMDKLEEVKGIAYRYDGMAIATELRGQIKNLDSLPLPDYAGLVLQRYRETTGLLKGRQIAPLITSRGCPFNCVYCSSHSMWGNWRARSIDNVLFEIEHLVEQGFDALNIVDDIFTINKKRVVKFCEGLLSRNLVLKWKIQTRADCLTLELLKLMKEAGCVSMAIGVESGSPSILENLNKKQDTFDVVNAFQWCKEVGIEATFNVIIGSPGETLETINETRGLIRQVKPTYISPAVLRAYPGTALWDRAVEEGLCDESFFLGDAECLQYTGAMSIPEMYAEARRYLLLQAKLNGIDGFWDLIRLGADALRRSPQKFIKGVNPLVNKK